MGKIIEFRAGKSREIPVKKIKNEEPNIDKDRDVDPYFLDITIYNWELDLFKKCIEEQIRKNNEALDLEENSVLDDMSAFIRDTEEENEIKSEYIIFVHVFELDFITKAVQQYSQATPAESKTLFGIEKRLNKYKKEHLSILENEYKITLPKNIKSSRKLDIIYKDWEVFLKNNNYQK